MAKKTPAHDPVSQAMMAIEDALSLSAESEASQGEEMNRRKSPQAPEEPVPRLRLRLRLPPRRRLLRSPRAPTRRSAARRRAVPPAASRVRR